MNEQHCQEHFKVSEDRTGIQPRNSANAIPRGIKKKYRNIEWELYFVLLLSLLYTSRILLQTSFCSNGGSKSEFSLATNSWKTTSSGWYEMHKTVHKFRTISDLTTRTELHRTIKMLISKIFSIPLIM